MYLQAFLRMVLSDTFGGDVSHYIVIIAAVVIACFAWWSTATTEHPHIRTVFLLEGRLRRRPTARSRLTTHIESASIVENTQAEVDSSSQEAASATNTTSMEPNKPPEASTSRTASCSESATTTEEEEHNRIVEIMDANVDIVRRRRLDFYQNNQNNEQDDFTSNSSSAFPASTTEQAVPDRGTIGELDSAPTEEPPLMEHNYAERDTAKPLAKEKDPENAPPSEKESSIRIKLKYLNDDLKLVDGRLEELLGDFKRRHFEVELSDNKIVRLIFNGQVLHSDAKTLQSCGFFDNCVVHCLVHQQRGTFSENNTSHPGESASAREQTGLPRAANNNTQGRDWDLGNLLFLCTSLILISAWYFRYEYSHLYTITATVALVAITGIFTIFLVGMYFPDHGQQPQPQQAQPAES